MSINSMWTDFRSQPLQTLARWQDRRALWLLMVGLSLFMVVLAHSVFQVWLYMRPCEQCVYIRFAFFCMAAGGAIAAVKPDQGLLKLTGYALAFWGVVQGIGYSLKLDRIHHAAHSDDPFGVQGCSAEPSFPLGLPLDRWSPEWFKPTGDCGYDNPIIPDGAQLSSLQKAITDFYAEGWYLWPPEHFMNMAQATLITFAVCLLVLSVCALAWIVGLVRGRPDPAVKAANA